jgi:hypothetical protein
MSLGDFFPQEDKRQSIKRQFVPGQVLYLFCSFTTPQPKNKFLFVACVNPRPLLFVINSQINDFISNRPHLRRCQVSIKSGDYKFLTHDSFINCTEAKDDFDYSDIEIQLLNDMTRIRGPLSQPCVDEIIEAVKLTKALAPRYKAWILASLHGS